MMQQQIANGIYLTYNAYRMYLFVHKQIVNRYFSGYSLEYMMTPAERILLLQDKADLYNAYEIYKDMDCAVAFKEISRFSEIRKMILSPKNLDNTLFRRYSGYTEWYNEINPQNKIGIHFDWTDCYLEAHHRQQNMIDTAIEGNPPPFWVLAEVSFDEAYAQFQRLLDKLPWEYSGPLENYDNPLYDSIYFDFSKRLVKKRIWLGTSYLLYGLQNAFHTAPNQTSSRETTQAGKTIFNRMIKMADYEQSPIHFDLEKYDHCCVRRLTEMLKANKISFEKTS